MLVRELIQRLQALPQDAHVLVDDDDTGYLWDDVQVLHMDDQPVVIITSEWEYGGNNMWHTTTDFVESLK